MNLGRYLMAVMAAAVMHSAAAAGEGAPESQKDYPCYRGVDGSGLEVQSGGRVTRGQRTASR